MIRYKSYAMSNQGNRPNNEDAYHPDDILMKYVIADGLGGFRGGDIASSHLRQALTSVQQSECTETFLLNRLNEVNSKLHRVGKSQEYQHLGTTGDILFFDRKDQIIKIIHIGDCRVYALFDNNELKLLTEDQNEAYDAVQRGKMEKEKAAVSGLTKKLTNYVGRYPELDSVIYRIEAEEQKRIKKFLMTTDGIHGVVSQSELQSILTESRGNQALERIYHLVNNPVEMVELHVKYKKKVSADKIRADLSANDNFTAILIERRE